MTRHLSFLSLILTAWLSGLAQPAMAAPVPEYEMKAAYLYNFATLTDWPANIATNKSIKLCVLGNDSFGGALEKLTRNSTGGLRITLSYLANINEAHSCQMLFIDASEVKQVTEIINQLEKSPVLTVTDNHELFRAGAMIGLFLDNKRLMFDIDYGRAQNAQLNISSKLLRVARTVHQ